MYANAPHASAAPSPVAPHQHLTPQVQHGHPHGMPPATTGGGSHGIPSAGVAHPALQQRVVQPGAEYVTGAYQSSGDPAIDRMLRLEAAAKRFASLI